MSSVVWACDDGSWGVTDAPDELIIVQTWRLQDNHWEMLKNAENDGISIADTLRMIEREIIRKEQGGE